MTKAIHMWGPLGDEGWSANLASKTLQTRMGKAKKEMKKKKFVPNPYLQPKLENSKKTV